jgi:plasmid maintenance system antidote protein VapI
MTASSTSPELAEHFAHCVQVLGGVTTAARRLGIDERAIRRFINGERPISTGLMNDTAQGLRRLIADATEAENQISTILNSAPDAE